MKKKWYWIALIIVILLIVFSSPYLYLQYINYRLANINSKYCEQSSDCILEPGYCCSEVFGNKEYVELQRTKDNIENLFSNQYIAQCFCPLPPFAAIIYNASCESNECVKKPYLYCYYLCEEYNSTKREDVHGINYTLEQINETLNNTASILNRTIADINSTCNC